MSRSLVEAALSHVLFCRSSVYRWLAYITLIVYHALLHVNAVNVVDGFQKALWAVVHLSPACESSESVFNRSVLSVTAIVVSTEV